MGLAPYATSSREIWPLGWINASVSRGYGDVTQPLEISTFVPDIRIENWHNPRPAQNDDISVFRGHDLAITIRHSCRKDYLRKQLWKVVEGRCCGLGYGAESVIPRSEVFLVRLTEDLDKLLHVVLRAALVNPSVTDQLPF